MVSLETDLLHEKVEDFVNYLTYEKRYSPHTVKSYERDLCHFIQSLKENFPEVCSWSDVGERHLRQVIRVISCLDPDKKDLSNRSRARLVSSLKSFYKYLVLNGQVSVNLMSDIKTPKFSTSLPTYLTYEQFEKLVSLPLDETPQSYRDRAIVELIFASGVRVSELVGIRMSDIDFEKMEIRIIGKGNKERIVPFGSYSLQAIFEWLAVRDVLVTDDCDYLFVNRFGNKMNPRAVQISLKKMGLNAEIPIKLTPHKLRHSFATEMLAGGADIRVVQEILGHTSLSITQIYLHLDIERLKSVYNKAHPLSSVE
jgi:site-specific recombinase XerD